jgi:arylsulfatase A-like enzyme
MCRFCCRIALALSASMACTVHSAERPPRPNIVIILADDHGRQAGCQTAIVGKWHLFTEPTGFDFFSVLPGHGRYFDSPFKETGQPWGDSGNRGGVIHPGYVTDWQAIRTR